MKEWGLNGDCNECLSWVMKMWKKQSFSHIPTTLISIFWVRIPWKIYHTKGGGRRKRLPSPCGNALQAFSSLEFDIT